MAARGARTGTLHQTENEPAAKRQRTVAAAAGRQPLATAAQPPGEEPIVFTGREDVENLLNEKMDYKGKSEQMMQYIRKLRACIKWLLEREDANLAQSGKLTADLEAAETQHSEKVSQLQNALQESKEIYEELKKQNAPLEETLQKVESEKKYLLKSLGDENKANISLESSRKEILEDLEKAKFEEKRLNDQVKMPQETNKRLQDYNSSLQQYSSKLQADATKNDDTGESSYVPGVNREVQQLDSDDDTGGQETPNPPPSVGTKRTSSTSTTASTPTKKRKGAAMLRLEGTLSELNELFVTKADEIKEARKEKAVARRLNVERREQFFKAKADKVTMVLNAARNANLSEADSDLWYHGVLEIIENDTWMTAFLATPSDRMRAYAQFYADKVAARVNN